MAIPLFLAQTSAEFAAADSHPGPVAWMACHFSLYSTGLSGLPPALPADSLLILNDRTPLSGHDPQRIGEQLQQTADTLKCSSILLDFQRPGMDEAASLASYLVSALSCPVAVSDLYASDLNCPVFLSPCPHHVPLSEYLLPWKGRQLWLDLAVDAETITITKNRSQILPLPLGEIPAGGHRETLLHCHYSMETCVDSVRFTLWRNGEDMAALAEAAEVLGVETLVGLYSEYAKAALD